LMAINAKLNIAYFFFCQSISLLYHCSHLFRRHLILSIQLSDSSISSRNHSFSKASMMGLASVAKFVLLLLTWSWDRAVSIVTGYKLDDRRVGVRVTVGSRIFSMSSRLVLGPTQPPIQWVLAALPSGVKQLGRKPITHLHLVLRSRKRGSVHLLPHMSSWHSV
jgi:hypothetical protein